MINILLKKRIAAHQIEVILLVIMALIGLAAILVFVNAINLSNPDPVVVILELLLLIIIGILGNTFVCVKIYEQNHPVYAPLIKKAHSKTNKKSKKAKTKKKTTKRKKK